MTGPRANDCVDALHLHVGICQRAGYANGRLDQADEVRAIARKVAAEFEALRLAVDELCPHGPEQHAEGTCSTCDTAFAVDAAIEEAAENIAGLLTSSPGEQL